jgi:hypothetical protein
MSDDLPNSDVADQLHDDLLVKWLTDSNNTEFSNDLEKGASVDEASKTVSAEGFSTASLGGFKKTGRFLSIYSGERRPWSNYTI